MLSISVSLDLLLLLVVFISSKHDPPRLAYSYPRECYNCTFALKQIQRETALLLKTVKRGVLYLGYVLLSYVLIYNLEVSFSFHLTFLQLNVIKMFTAQ